MILYLIRHGETDWNREKRVMGRRPVPLNGRGRRGARRVAEYLAASGIEEIHCGTLARTVQTAEILAGVWNVPVIRTGKLDESAFENWVGSSYGELRDDPEFNMYLSRPTGSNFSIDEGMRDIQERAVGAAGRIAARGDVERAAIVSHSDVIKPMLVHWLGMDLDLMHRISISNASISRVELREILPPAVRYMNLLPGKQEG
jgi:probable phosphoglycerate mutase